MELHDGRSSVTMVMSHEEASLLGEFIANFCDTDPDKHPGVKTALPRDNGVAPRWEVLRELFRTVMENM